ncbi:hypothetical protein [Saccharothrix xinjiangensis]|uniref:Uncharacterized protein n=1 Tax=Saccharothrix xinjiangensis TaxID=204798 RepID=A0ABV9XU19_9PSEU
MLVIGIAALLFFTLGGGGGGNSTAKGAAESFAAALTAKDFEKMRSLTCPEYQARVDDMRKLYDAEGQLDEIEKQLESLPAEMREQAMKSIEAAKNIKFTATATDVKETSDTTAEATMTVKYENVPEDMKTIMKDQEDTLYLDKTDDGWVACDK